MGQIQGNSQSPIAPPVTPIETKPPVVTPPIIANPTSPLGPHVHGFDVSHYILSVNWDKAFRDNVLWMYTKATEGTGYVDASLKTHVTSAAKAGLLTQAYHFFHASMDGIKQADHFLQTIEGLNLDLPHILDWESSSADGMPSEIQAQRAKAWLSRVEAVSGHTPWIYGGEYFIHELKLAPEFARYPLIVAHYGTTESHVKVPAPWTKYTAWQFTDKDTYEGKLDRSSIDGNWFNGTLDELKAFRMKPEVRVG